MVTKHKLTALHTWLPGFFTEYQNYRAPPVVHAQRPKAFQIEQIDISSLTKWFDDMTQPMIDAREGAFHFDPWAVAGLGRDEVRNSAVLAWLLNPKGSHGLGDAAMRGLLSDLSYFDSRFPTTCDPFCRVRVESNPDGNSGNRVDIEIDDKNFYVIIEVKIGAPEGKEQMKRYGDIANSLAGSSIPWALFFLTPEGRPSDTAAQYSNRVVSISWSQLAFSIGRAVKASSRRNLNTKSATRHMAEQAVQRFLKKIRTFNF